MNKAVKVLLIATGSIVSLGIFGRLTGAFQYYVCPTPANEPTFKVKSKFFASNLVKPERFDFICFKGYNPYFDKVELSFYRLCGLPGDVVEIKNGKLYVNKSYADGKFNVKHLYKISNKDFAKLPEEIINNEDVVMESSGDSTGLFLEDKWIVKNRINAVRVFVPDPDSSIAKKFNEPWTADNFGPIEVPANSYFVLGDNRENAMDSRYRGFISKDSVVSTVLWKR